MESTLYLMKNVDLDPNYNYTIDFDNLAKQEAYFDSKISLSLEENTGYSYIKENEPIKVYQNIDELYGVNYLRYTNNHKTYYAFIINKKWVSDSCTALEFKIDVFQSFMFDYEISESFIDREHQDRYYKTDNILEPIYSRTSEQLERGNQYICKNIKKIEDNVPAIITTDFASMISSGQFQLFWVYIIANEDLCSELYNKIGTATKQLSINKGMPTNTYGYVVPMATISGTYGGARLKRFTMKLKSDSANEFGTISQSHLKELSEDPRILSINISRYAPFNYNVEKTTSDTIDTYTFIPIISNEIFDGIYLGKITYSDDSFNGLFNFAYFNKDIFQQFNLNDNYQKLLSDININNIKNIELEPKLNTSDYKYYELSYGNQNIKLNIEDWLNRDNQLKLISSFSVKNGQAMIPLHYKGMAEAFTDMLTFDSITNELPLRTDAWKNYLSTNKNSLITGFATNAIQGATQGAITGASMGGVYGAIAGGILGVFNGISHQLAQIKDIQNTPDKVAKTTIDTTLDYAIDDVYFKLNTYEIHDQFKMIIFNYFYHYGYKCNDFKKPNTRSRYYFNFIKTIGVNIKTNIDAEYKAQLATIFDNGITIWHYRDNETFKGVNNFDYENAEINLIGGTNG